MGIPGPFSASTSLPHSEQNLWDVVEEAFEAAVRFTALMCPCCSTHLKEVCDHPILVLSEPVTLENFCEPMKYQLPASREAATEHVDLSFPATAGTAHNAAMVDASLQELAAAIQSGRLAAGLISPDGPIDMQQLDQDGRDLAAKQGVEGLPSEATLTRLRQIASDVHRVLMAIRDWQSRCMPGPESSQRDRTEAHVQRCMRCMEHYEEFFLPEINQLTGLLDDGTTLYPTLRAAMNHIAMATASCGGWSSATAMACIDACPFHDCIPPPRCCVVSSAKCK